MRGIIVRLGWVFAATLLAAPVTAQEPEPLRLGWLEADIPPGWTLERLPVEAALAAGLGAEGATLQGAYGLGPNDDPGAPRLLLLTVQFDPARLAQDPSELARVRRKPYMLAMAQALPALLRLTEQVGKPELAEQALVSYEAIRVGGRLVPAVRVVVPAGEFDSHQLVFGLICEDGQALIGTLLMNVRRGESGDLAARAALSAMIAEARIDEAAVVVEPSRSEASRTATVGGWTLDVPAGWTARSLPSGDSAVASLALILEGDPATRVVLHAREEGDIEGISPARLTRSLFVDWLKSGTWRPASAAPAWAQTSLAGQSLPALVGFVDSGGGRLRLEIAGRIDDGNVFHVLIRQLVRPGKVRSASDPSDQAEERAIYAMYRALDEARRRD